MAAGRQRHPGRDPADGRGPRARVLSADWTPAGTFRRTRAGALVVHDGQVLMMGQTDVHESTRYRWFHFPGGGWEADETIEAAVARELLEETGLRGTVRGELIQVVTDAMLHRYFVVDCDDVTLGECTGPELEELAPEIEFAAEWIALDGLDEVPVWPRAVVDPLRAHVAGAPLPEAASLVHDERIAWEGTNIRGWRPRRRASIVLVVDDRLAVIEREHPERGRYATLPGGGIEPGESAEEAAVREAMEELGVHVRVAGVLAVVQWVAGRSTQVYVRCVVDDASRFGTGAGDEFTAAREATHGTYRPRLLTDEDLAGADLRPAWLLEALPRWLAHDGVPEEPMRFFEP